MRKTKPYTLDKKNKVIGFAIIYGFCIVLAFVLGAICLSSVIHFWGVIFIIFGLILIPIALISIINHENYHKLYKLCEEIGTPCEATIVKCGRYLDEYNCISHYVIIKYMGLDSKIHESKVFIDRKDFYAIKNKTYVPAKVYDKYAIVDLAKTSIRIPKKSISNRQIIKLVFCKYCGTKNNEFETFCTGCSNKL